MVTVTEATFPGCVIEVKAIALFRMEDEKGVDDKLLCVPLQDPPWNGLEKLDDLTQLPLHLLNEIEHFFDVYKMLEEDKSSATRGYEGKDCAWEEIRRAQERYVPHP